MTASHIHSSVYLGARKWRKITCSLETQFCLLSFRSEIVWSKEESNARSTTKGSLGNAKKLERKVRVNSDSIESHRSTWQRFSIHQIGREERNKEELFNGKDPIVPGTKSQIEETTARSLYQRGHQNLEDFDFANFNRSQKIEFAESEIKVNCSAT